MATDLVSPSAVSEATAATDGREVGLFIYNAGGNAEDVARQNGPDRTKVVADVHRMMQKVRG